MSLILIEFKSYMAIIEEIMLLQSKLHVPVGQRI